MAPETPVLANAWSSMNKSPSCNVGAAFRFIQPKNAPSPMLTIRSIPSIPGKVLFMMIFSREVSPENA